MWIISILDKSEYRKLKISNLLDKEITHHNFYDGKYSSILIKLAKLYKSEKLAIRSLKKLNSKFKDKVLIPIKLTEEQLNLIIDSRISDIKVEMNSKIAKLNHLRKYI